MSEPVRLPVALIGAADVQSLQEFVAAAPAGGGMAYIVITPPLPEDDLASLLRPHTTLPISPLDEQAVLEPDCIYLLPPTRSVVSLDPSGQVVTTRETHPAPIDACFRQLAPLLQSYALGVLLGGPGADGALGLTHIREAGGLTAVRAMRNTAADAMLAHALAVGPVDLVLPVNELLPRLVAYSGRLSASEQWDDDQTPPVGAQGHLKHILAYVLHATGEDLSVFQPGYLLRKIEKRCRLLDLPDLAAYRRVLAEQEHEAHLLRRETLWRARQFRRDPQSLAVLADKILPQLLQTKESAEPVRVWAAGCATGEEAYTICILLLEAAAHLAKTPEIRLFATHMNEEVIRQAREGVFPSTITADVGEGWLARYFVREGESYRISPVVRQQIVFASHNLFQMPPFLKLDLIVCRSLLSTLAPARREQLTALFFQSLQPMGYLLTGSGEMAQASSFVAVAGDLPLYQRQAVIGPHQLAFASKSPNLVWPVDRMGVSYETVYNRRLQQHTPPGLLVDAGLNIVYYATGVSPYLYQPGGAATEQVLERVRPELREALASVLAETAQTGRSACSQPIKLGQTESAHFVQLCVEPVETADQQKFWCVLFRPFDAPSPTEPLAADRISQLETAMAVAYQKLQLAGEEYASVNEEMSAANEELLSLNEELYVKAAELERSKEELQSANEELLMINRENQRNIEQLRFLTANLQNLIAATDIPTLFLDRNLCIRWFSPALQTIFNVLPGDEGRPLAHITHCLHYHHFVQDAADVVASSALCTREMSSDHGEWYYMRILPYRTLDQQIDGAVITFVNITERRRAETALLELNLRLEQRVEERTLELARSNRELDQFAYIASHDLKAPLRAVHNLAEWVQKDNADVLSPTSQEHLSKLRKRIDRMDRLLDDLLTYSRVGRQRHQPVWVDTGVLIRGLRHVLVVPTGFRMEFHTSLPVLYTERVPLETILRNLIGNAIKHHHRPAEGVVEISTADGGDWVEFTVKDNGPGIAPQHQERIFQIFQSLRPRDEVEGSGMGLAIAKKVVESHGGYLQVESQLGQGATFRFTWPKAASQAAGQPAAQPAKQ